MRRELSLVWVLLLSTVEVGAIVAYEQMELGVVRGVKNTILPNPAYPGGCEIREYSSGLSTAS